MGRVSTQRNMLRLSPTTVKYLEVVQSLIADVLHIVPCPSSRKDGYTNNSLNTVIYRTVASGNEAYVTGLAVAYERTMCGESKAGIPRS